MNPKLCKSDCGLLPYIAPVYFLIFVVASQFILLNVVIAVLMKHLESAKVRPETPLSTPQSLTPAQSRDNLSVTSEDHSPQSAETTPFQLVRHTSYANKSMQNVGGNGDQSNNSECPRFYSLQSLTHAEDSASATSCVEDHDSHLRDPPSTKCDFEDHQGT